MSKKTKPKVSRWTKWDSFHDGRAFEINSREVGRLYRDIDYGWRYFWAQRAKRGVMQS